LSRSSPCALSAMPFLNSRIPWPPLTVAAKRRQAACSQQDRQHQDHDQVLVVHRSAFVVKVPASISPTA
jgi:hypothetical protein